MTGEYMPTESVPGGYRWGKRGKVYPTKAQADKQGRAARAAGYGSKSKTSKKGKGKRK